MMTVTLRFTPRGKCAMQGRVSISVTNISDRTWVHPPIIARALEVAGLGKRDVFLNLCNNVNYSHSSIAVFNTMSMWLDVPQEIIIFGWVRFTNTTRITM